VKSIGDLLKEYMRERGWLGGNPYEPLFKEWRKIAGEGIASHARLIDIQNGILLVEVDHPGWLQLVQMKSAALLAAARATAPLAVVEGLKIRVGATPPAEEHGGNL
jgi:predicted nucleic acid-binding Zn ribbon protein